MHMSVSKRAASTRCLSAMVLAGALGLLLPAGNSATAIEPVGVDASATRPAPQDALPTPNVGDRRGPGGMHAAEATPPQATMPQASASGSGVVSAQVLRALLSDPAIRTFLGTAENAWDFTQPDTIPGFGRLP